MHYEHLFLGGGPNHASSNRSLFWRDSRIVKVKPTSKWSQFVLFSKRHHYKTFEVTLYGGDVGFPENTAVNLSTKKGHIVRITCSDAIKPSFSNGQSAVNWTYQKHKIKAKTVFVTGPNVGIQVTMHVILLLKGKEVPDDDLRVLVSPPEQLPIDVDHDTDVKWSSSK